MNMCMQSGPVISLTGAQLDLNNLQQKVTGMAKDYACQLLPSFSSSHFPYFIN